MERNMTTGLYTTTIDDRLPATCSAVSGHDVTPLDIQRWEDDGGAVLPDAMPRKQRSLRHPDAALRHGRAERHLHELAAAE